MTTRRDSAVKLYKSFTSPPSTGLVRDPYTSRDSTSFGEYKFARPNNKCELFARGSEFWPDENSERGGTYQLPTYDF